MMCYRRRQEQHIFLTTLRGQTQQLSRCAAQRQQRRELKVVAIDGLPALTIDLNINPVTNTPLCSGYQPRSMAGILVMGLALGLQEGGKKIKEKRDEKKAKKVALVSLRLAESHKYH